MQDFSIKKSKKKRKQLGLINCKKLNVDAGASDIGKKPFIVINGQIMAVQADGKLSRYANQPSAMTNNNNTKISPSIQNTPVCSQHLPEKTPSQSANTPSQSKNELGGSPIYSSRKLTFYVAPVFPTHL